MRRRVWVGPLALYCRLMHAIEVRRTGGPEVLDHVEIEEPSASAGRVVVDVAAAGVNYIDTYQREGLYPMALPFTLGMEGAGTVVSVAPDVDLVAVGDRVAWTDAMGSYAERVSLPAERVVPIPDDVGDSDAAAVMLQGLTAHYLATSTYPIEPGHRCLIHAGAGGVGRLLIQIAKARGAEVFTTVGSEEKAAVAEAVGADHIVNYREVAFVTSIASLAGDRPLDVVFDGVGASTFEPSLTLLKPRGMMVTFGNASGPVPPLSPLVLAQNGSLYLTRPTLADYIGQRIDLEARSADLFDWLADGTLDLLVGATHPLADAAEAHRELEGRSTTGKTLLIP